MAGKVKRSQIQHFLNTGTPGSPVWKLIGEGVTTGQIEYNPNTSQEIYIHEDSGVTQIDSYSPTLPLEATAIAGDEVFDYVDNLRITRAVLAAAETEVVNVWMYKTGGPTAYPAEKQACSVQINSIGGDGGVATKISYTINFLGDPDPGTFNATTSAFST